MAIEKKIKVTVDASDAKRQIDALVGKLNATAGATDRTSSSTSRLSSNQSNLNGKIIGVNRSLNAMSGLLAKIASAATIITGIKLADDFNELQNKLRITLVEGEKLADVQKRLVDVSLKTRTSLQENANLYLRLASSVDRTKVSQEELFRITETVNKAIQIGGSNAQEAQGALRQFTQIISSGFTTGFSQELNSIFEQAPGLRDVLANGLREVSDEFRNMEASGVTAIKILKTFSEEGLGDIDMLLSALASQFQTVNDQYGNVNVTVAKAFGNLKASLENYIGAVDDATGFTSGLALRIDDLAQNFDSFADKVASAMQTVGVAILSFGVVALVKFTIRVLAAGRAAIFAAIAATRLAKAFLFFANPAGGLALAVFAVAELILKLEQARKSFSGLSAVVAASGTFPDALSLDQLSGEIHTQTDVIKKLKEEYFDLGSTIEGLSNLGVSGDTIIDGIGDQSGKTLNQIISEQETIAKQIRSNVEYLNQLLNKQAEKEREISRKTIEAANKLIDTEKYKTFEKLKIEKEYNDRIDALRKARDIVESAQVKAQADKIIAELIRQRDEKLGIKAKYDQDDLDKLISSLRSEREALIAQSKERKEIVAALVNDEKQKADLILKINRQLQDGLSALNQNSDADERRDRLQSIKDSLKSEEQLIKERYDSERRFIDANVTSLIEAEIIKSQLRKKEADELAALTENIKKSMWDQRTTREKLIETISRIGNAAKAFTDLFGTLASIRQQELDKELSTSEDLSDEERKTKEKNAEAAFEANKRYTIAGIALQTGLAIMSAFAEPGMPFALKAINAAAAAATGAAQFAKAKSQNYSAPSAPSASGVSSQQTSNTDNRQITINVTSGTASPEDIAKAISSYIDNDGIIINPESAQGRALSV